MAAKDSSIGGLTVDVVRADDPSGIERARAIRREVFVGEFAITLEEEMDDLDGAPGTVHLVAGDADGDLGTVRLVADATRAGVVHVTRVAVRSAARRRGVGAALMVAAERIARRDYARGHPPAVRLELSVMESAVPFYAALGYAIGDVRHVEVRIWHRRATKVLVGSGSGPEGECR